MDDLIIGGIKLSSRLFVGTGKYSSNELIPEVLKESGSKVITLAVRRIDFDNKEENPLEYIPKDTILLPNTSGARNASEAIRLARLARAMGCGNWIKIEVISDNKYLMPNNLETLKATEALANEGFVVLPYMSPDIYFGHAMKEAGAAAIMPLASPIGSNKGLKTKELIRMMIEEIDVPIVVDAGIGRPSHAMEAMELGASACLVNTAIASSKDPKVMARAFKLAVEGGRLGYLAKFGEISRRANASSPLTGFLR
ncbi:thiazole synthase [Sarcina sp. JB2]|uniref:Thiazole synthase n=1 Tax=Candidatus Sarcina troglodytae TaxID=2726954 RepID=A0ACD1BDG6_9CLOT|nr:thiazole synthase [Sarcina sp. JB2]QPJ85433.1 thiazole synthase [Sarcina sp. JB2]